MDETKMDNKFDVLMWGYFPGLAAERSPLTLPETVRLPDTGDYWKDVCGGGCGFGIAITASGKLVTWGSADDQGQSYLTSGKHGESPETYILPTNDLIVKAAAGWAHCVSTTDKGEVYTWGWKECVPSGIFFHGLTNMKSTEDEIATKKSSSVTDAGSTCSQDSKCTIGKPSLNDKKAGDENVKRRKIETEDIDASTFLDETLSMPPCLVNMDPGVKVTCVAAGGRHTLALSDVGQVWGWGYGGEGQLGLGTRIKMVATPHIIPFINLSNSKGSSAVVNQETSATGSHQSVGNYIKGIACGGRHSAVVTDAGILLAFGWGQYGQCGQGNNDDLLKPTCVPSLMGKRIEAVAAGLWHTICISADGSVHSFGGNQFGQLGLGTTSEQCETVPKLIDASVLEGKKAKIVSSGARHSAIVTGKRSNCLFLLDIFDHLGPSRTLELSLKAKANPQQGKMTIKFSVGGGTSMVSLVSGIRSTETFLPKFYWMAMCLRISHVAGGIHFRCVRVRQHHNMVFNNLNSGILF